MHSAHLADLHDPLQADSGAAGWAPGGILLRASRPPHVPALGVQGAGSRAYPYNNLSFRIIIQTWVKATISLFSIPRPLAKVEISHADT